MKSFEEFINNHYYSQPIVEADDNKTEDDAVDGDGTNEKTGSNLDIVEPVETEKTKEKKDYFFKNIIFFTNERDSKKNKTLKNLEQAIKGTDIQLYSFVADEVNYKASQKMIDIKDTVTKLKINTQSNVDTIVIVRLGAQDSEECVELIKELQDWGFFVINPIQSAKKASNKYTSAVLMDRYEVPVPRFTLLAKNDIKDGEKSLQKKLKEIYPDVGKDEDADKKKEYVVKILDGHGGTGVFLVTGKTILSILQAIFAIDEERELLLQKKEEADGGDIRVHVLTMRTKQAILASMKRVKISGDFRSNVSLGAQAEKVELTPEQEEIALKVAKISGMPWCAVDIMPLVEGSNPDVGDNVVLEYNSSPGTDGISEVLDENFMEILLDNINDINELVLAPKSIGYIEDIALKLNENEEPLVIECKLDTGNGARASTIGCESIEIIDDEVHAMIEDKEYVFRRHGESNAIVGQVTENRITVLIPEIQIGSRKMLNAEFSLVDNRKKQQKVLLNRDLLSKMGYMIDPGKKHSLDDDIKRII